MYMMQTLVSTLRYALMPLQCRATVGTQVDKASDTLPGHTLLAFLYAYGLLSASFSQEQYSDTKLTWPCGSLLQT